MEAFAASLTFRADIGIDRLGLCALGRARRSGEGFAGENQEGNQNEREFVHWTRRRKAVDKLKRYSIELHNSVGASVISSHVSSVPREPPPWKHTETMETIQFHAIEISSSFPLKSFFVQRKKEIDRWWQFDILSPSYFQQEFRGQILLLVWQNLSSSGSNVKFTSNSQIMEWIEK